MLSSYLAVNTKIVYVKCFYVCQNVVVNMLLKNTKRISNYLFVHDGKVTLNNPGGTIYREKNGKQPVLDYRDPPRLRLKILTDIVRKAGEQ